MKRLHFILLGFLIFSTCTIYAQNPVFSQFYNNPIYLNPALAGSNHGCPRLNINSRYQGFFSGEFITTTLSSDRYARRLKGGISFQLVNEVSGHQTIFNNNATIGYSRHFNLSNKYTLLTGIQVGWHQIFLNWNKLSFGDMVDPRLGFIYATGDRPTGNLLENGWGTRGFLNLNIGIAFCSERFYGGFALKNINEPKQSLINSTFDSQLPKRLIAHFGAKIPVINQLVISPNMMFTLQDEFYQFNFGTNVKYRFIELGVYTRLKNTVIASIGFHLSHFRITYSYDYLDNSNFSPFNNNTHEISLMYFF